jgi:hypothetical protein
MLGASVGRINPVVAVDVLSTTIRADDPYAKVSGFFTLPKLWTEGISGKWLNIRNLIGCGTPLASFVDEARENSDVFHSTSMEVK